MFRPLVFSLVSLSLFACTHSTPSPATLRSQAALPPGVNPCNNAGSQAILPPGYKPPTSSKPCGCQENMASKAIIPPDQQPSKPGC